MITTKNIFSSYFALLIIIFGLLGYGFVSATWNAPTTNPPDENTLPPINVSTDDQVKLGGIGASAFKTPGTVWSPEYCDENGENCMSAGIRVPLAGEVGSLAWVTIAPTAPLPSGGSNSTVPAYRYGSIIEGIHLCPAGQYLTDGNSNNLSINVESSSNACDVTLSGTYQVLSFATTRSTTLISGGGGGRLHSMALVQKISDRCGVDMDQSCAVASLNSFSAITNLVLQKTGNKYERIYNGSAERAAVCEMLAPGSSVSSYTSGSYGQPGNNNVGRLVSGNWTLQYPATAYNNWINTVVCTL